MGGWVGGLVGESMVGSKAGWRETSGQAVSLRIYSGTSL